MIDIATSIVQVAVEMTNNASGVVAMTISTILFSGVYFVNLVFRIIHQTFTNPGMTTREVRFHDLK